jgi:DUF4097 and DUF4098 domain-containing protein YvlB
MRTMTIATVAAAAMLAGAAQAAAQADFQWRGQLGAGKTIEIKGINGDIRASSSTSCDVEVTASKTATRSNPNNVRIEVVPHAGGVTICAVYPDVPDREPNRCEPGREGHSNTRDNDTVVHFDVRVPYGVALAARTVNGEVNGESLQGDADARTVNGSIRLSTTGRATASTVNGSLNITMGRTDWTDDVSFKTVNGGITLAMPTLDAELRAETLNGSITADFPITVTGEVSRRRLRGTVGNGGHVLHLATVNGSIKLVRQ